MKLTKQNVLDIVYNHFVTLGNPPSVVTKKTRNNGTVQKCMYRSKNGAKCAAGVLLYKSEYNANFEGQPFFRVAPPRLKHLVGFIVELQYVHDGVATMCKDKVPSFRRKLKQVADRHGLKVPE